MNKENLLNKIKYPTDLRKMNLQDLKLVSKELREELIDVVSTTGGHLGAGLGVVELTIALHYVFNTPKDKLVWDVGHQSYPHKIITGRRSSIRTLRKGGGLSGFTKRAESEYDPFGAAHSSTSISSSLGLKAIYLSLPSLDPSVKKIVFILSIAYLFLKALTIGIAAMIQSLSGVEHKL